MGVVDKRCMAEAAIEVSIMINVRSMAANEHERRALTVASACLVERLSFRYDSKIIMATYQLNHTLLRDQEQIKQKLSLSR